MAQGIRIGVILKPSSFLGKNNPRRKRSNLVLAVLFLFCQAFFFFIPATRSSRIPRRNFSPVPSETTLPATQSQSFLPDRSHLFFLKTTTATTTVPKKTLKLSIYYETLCPDSLDFLKSQVKPLFQLLPSEEKSSTSLESPTSLPFHALLDISLVPYGKAMTLLRMPSSHNSDVRDDHQYTFICQHGPLECEGNKLHACLLELLFPPSRKPPGLFLQRSLMGFFICSMELLINSFGTSSSTVHHRDKLSVASHIKYVMKMCSHELHIVNKASESNFPPSNESSSSSSLLFAQVQNCLESEHSVALLKANGELTSSLRPKVTFIPWLTFNEVWDETLMKNGLKDLHKVLCGLMITSLQEWTRGEETLKANSNRGGIRTSFHPRIVGCETYE